MSDDDALRKGRLLEQFSAARATFEALQNRAKGDAKILRGIAEFLSSASTGGQISFGMPLETYLSEGTARLVYDLMQARTAHDDAKRQLSDLGIPIKDL